MLSLIDFPLSFQPDDSSPQITMAEDFFSERADQSEVKAKIVSKYFDAWARIIAPRTMLSDGRVAYIDLFAGPGRYEDGSASTPLMVLSKAIESPKLREAVVSIFNDSDENHTRTLQQEIARLDDIETLKHKPTVYTGDIDRTAAEYFESIRLIPTFCFIDPYGYKGLSSALVRSVIKDWGSDCVFFFNYSRINAGVSNELVFHHMEALFGQDNFKQLRHRITGKESDEREQLILGHLERAMTNAGAKFVLPFRFRNANGTRTTHHLIFVTKHQTGYEIMKEVMADESSQFDQGVPSLEYSPALAGVEDLFANALNDLEDDLVTAFAGKSVAMIDIYHHHNVGKLYIKNNYKAALANLEQAGRISTNRPNRRKGTFADAVVATFPSVPVLRK
jgi:three-Cys-motif partner protein